MKLSRKLRERLKNKPKREAGPNRLFFEQIEPRLLLSVDLANPLAAAADQASLQQVMLTSIEPLPAATVSTATAAQIAQTDNSSQGSSLATTPARSSPSAETEDLQSPPAATGFAGGPTPQAPVYLGSAPFVVTPEVESNNSINPVDTASALTLTESETGSGLFIGAGTGEQNPATGSLWDDPDYWSFQAYAGDIVSVCVSATSGGNNLYAELHDASDTIKASDDNDGPNNDAFISHYTIPLSGTYYIKVGNQTSSITSYTVDLVLARSIQQETDDHYSNNSLSGANTLTFTPAGSNKTAAVAGTIMGQEGSTLDVDYYDLGVLNAGNAVELALGPVSWSTLVGRLTLVNSSGTAVMDLDGNVNDGHFQGTILADGSYYAKVESLGWVHNDHMYRLADSSGNWADAEAEAVGQGGHLAAITDTGEQAWLAGIFPSLGQYWIGLNDQVSENTFVWSSGETVTYTNWASGHPLSTNPSYNFVTLYTSGQWFNRPNSSTYRGIMELPGAGADKEPGPEAQYLLNVNIHDTVPPQVIGVSGFPAAGTATSDPPQTFSVSFSESLHPDTIRIADRVVWQYNGHFYTLTAGSGIWEAAENEAEALYGHLAKVDDAGENQWLADTFGRFGSTWVGLTDQDQENTWLWADGSTLTYTNWASGRPLSNYTGYNYAYITAGGQWFDESNSATHYGIIEFTGADTDIDGLPDVLDPYPANPLNAFELRSAGADGIFDTADDVVSQLTQPTAYTGDTSVNLFINGGPLPDGRYRFTASSTITDVVGNNLDGNGDGAGGDNYTRTFDVSLPAGFTPENSNNDTISTATPLPLNQYGGFYLGQGWGRQDPADSTWTDPDYWSFAAEAGDIVSVTVVARSGGINPYVELHDSSDANKAYDYDSGPDNDAFISHYTIPVAGTYYVKVGNYLGGSPGSYEVHLNLARGLQQESDAGYSNNTVANANALTLTTNGAHREAVVTGTVMAQQGSTLDVDYYNLGILNTDNTVELSLTPSLPGTLAGRLTLVDSSGAAVTDLDGNVNDDHFWGTIVADGSYYALVQARFIYNDHEYRRTGSSGSWADAEAEAVALGGHLAAITDAAEQAWLAGIFSLLGESWIGLSDQAAENTFVWSSGEIVSYTNWSSGHPLNNNPSYNFVTLASSGLWLNRPNSGTYRGFMELPGAGADKEPGPNADYILTVDTADLTPPRVTGVSGLPAAGTTTGDPTQSFSLTFSEPLLPATVNAGNRLVWSYDGHFYTPTTGAMIWSAAEAEAEALGGRLAKVEDAAENQWLADTFGRFGSTWVGLSDQDQENTWLWADGGTPGYTNWAPNRPFSNYTSRNFAYIAPGGQWSDEYNTYTHYGIIELTGADTDTDGLPDVLDPYPEDPLNAFDLRSAGADEVFDTIDDVIYRLTEPSPYTGGTSVSLFINGGPLPDGHYRFTANRTITDVVGNNLEGNGGGPDGQAYEQDFYVTLPTGFTLESSNNDTMYTATPLPLTETPTGSGLYLGQGWGRQDPADSTWTDPDYWSFAAEAGDIVSVTVVARSGGINPYVELHDSSDANKAYDYDSGPDNDAFISHYTIPVAGTYYVKVGNYLGGSPGSYEVHLNLARGLQQESDAGYSNNTFANANALTLTTNGAHREVVVTGTVMAQQGSTLDVDYYNLGILNTDNTVELSLTPSLPGTLAGRLTLVDSSGAAVTDLDGNVNDDHFLGTIPADGTYYALVQARFIYNDHEYRRTGSSGSWADAEAEAVALGGHLAAITDAAEQAWLAGIFSLLGESWIGLSDQAAENTFVWSSGEIVSYTNWSSGHPLNNNPSYNFVTLASSGLWLNRPNSGTYRGFMELPGAGADKEPGPNADYILTVDTADLTPPRVTGVSGLPAAGTTTGDPTQSFSLTFSEPLLPATVNAGNRLVWSYDGHFYTPTTGAMIWSAAEAEAEALGGRLAKVEDAAENQWLADTFGRFGSTWVGLSDQDQENTWLWADGGTPGYTNWAPNRPFSNYTSRNFAYIAPGGQWSDEYNTYTHYGIIELTGADTDTDGLPDVLDPYPEDPLNAFDLRSAGADEVFDTIDDVIYRLTEPSPYTGGTSVSLFINGGPLPDGHYRFTANRTITDVVGNNLEGNGGGPDGQAYEQDFYVTLPTGFTLESSNNDTMYTATPLPLTETPTGSGLYLGQGWGRQDPADSTWTDPDYWSFAAEAGDIVSVTVVARSGGINPYVELHDSSDANKAYDYDSGPDNDAFISHYTIPVAGTYYVKVGNYLGGSPGSYEVHLNLARGLQQESDAGYSNNTFANANALTLTTNGAHREAVVTGTVMAQQGSTLDVDYYNLGILNTDNTVELSLTPSLPGTLAGRLTLVDSSGAAVTDLDGNVNDDHFLGTIPADGTYYALVQARFIYNDHEYRRTGSSGSWADAEAEAVALGGHLAAITDAAEQAWLAGIFSLLGESWIGLNDQAAENTFVWSSGEIVSYTNWSSGHPLNNNPSYNFVTLASSGLWLNRPNSGTYRGLMELPGAGADKEPGPNADYILTVDSEDLVPPRVTGVSGLPAAGITTGDPTQSFSVSFSEALEPATVNAGNRMVWQHNGHFYTLTNVLNWSLAEAEAAALGGHLVKVEDAAENQWLADTFGRFGSTWIGLSDQDQENTWLWADGGTPGYTNWAPNRPFSNYTSRNFAYIAPGGQWSDEYNTYTHYGIIELTGADTDTDGLPDVLDPYPEDPLNAFDLRSAGADEVFDTIDDVIYRLTEPSPYTGGTSVSLFINGGPLSDGHYRFTANRTLTDLVNLTLDGNGDGFGGDAYMQVFHVSLPTGFTLENSYNDTSSTSTPLPLIEDPYISGLFIGRGLGRQDPAGSTWSDPDYWSFDAQAGDIVSVSVNILIGSTNLYGELHDSLDANLMSDDNSGSDTDAFISHYTIPGTGTYYVKVGNKNSSPGSYEIHVDLARGIQQESDANYSNNSIAGANAITWTTVNTHQEAIMAGTVMSPGDSRVDADYFNLGYILSGKTFFLSLRLPDASTLDPVIEVRNSSGEVVSIAPNPSGAVARLDVTQADTYYAVVLGTAGSGPDGQYLLDAAIWSTGELQFADLVVSEISHLAAAYSGGILQIGWTVGNYGTSGPNMDNWYDQVVLSPSDRIADGMTLASVLHTGGLAVGEPYSESVDVQLPIGFSGDYHIFVKTDQNNAVFEYIFDANNISESAVLLNIEPTPYADLTVSDIIVPTVGMGGFPITLSWQVSNAGTGTTGDGTPGGVIGSWTDRIVFSANDLYGDNDDRLVADVMYTEALDAGGYYFGSFHGALPADLSGHYYVFAFTDSNDDVYEQDNSYANLAQSLGTILVYPEEELGEIRGTVFDDQNDDGYKETDEPGLENWTVFLDANENGILDSGETSTLTDASGGYAFTVIPAASYRVVEVQQPGYDQTAPVSGFYEIPVPAGSIITGLDFGNHLSVNQPPVLEVIGDKIVDEETLLTFTLSATDPDLPPQDLIFSAYGLPDGATLDPVSGLFSWTPTETQGPGTYLVTFAVFDGFLADSENVAITVNDINQAPVLAAVGTKVVDEGSNLSFTLSAADPDVPAQSLTYSATGLPAGASLNSSTGLFSWTPTEAQGPGNYAVTFAVSDGLLTNSQTVTITVNDINEAPVLAAIGTKVVDEGSSLSFNLSAADPDLPSQYLTYSAAGLPDGASLDPYTGFFSWTPTEAQGAGAYLITFDVFDGFLTDSETVAVTVNEINQAPVLAVVGTKVVNKGSNLSFNLSAADPDLPSQYLIYSAAGLPDGASLDPYTGFFSWTPTEAQGPGTYLVTFDVFDGFLADNENVAITVNEINQAPVLTAVGTKVVDEGSNLSFNLSATDPDLPSQTLTYSAVGLPDGASLDPIFGLFSWTPTEAQGPGDYAVTFAVSDGFLTDSETVAVTVNEVNQAPVLADIGNNVVNENTHLSFTITTVDPDLPIQALTYSASSLPAGASLDPHTGLFSWTPTHAQSGAAYPITVEVMDAEGKFSTQSFAVRVNELYPPVAVTDNFITLQDTPVVMTVLNNDLDISNDTLHIAAFTQPFCGKILSNGDGTMTYTPNSGFSGSDSFIYTITDDHGGMAKGKVYLSVTYVPPPNQAPVLADIGNKAVNEGTNLSFTLGAADPDLPAQTLIYIATGLPDGATLNPATGLFSWTPTEAQGPGNYAVTFAVFDGFLTDSENIAITVNEVNQAPVLGLITCKSMAVGSNLTFTVFATDPDLPVQTLTYSAVGLFDGATLDPTTGLFSWTPINALTGMAYPITVKVTDPGGLSSTQSFAIKVLRAPLLAMETVAEASTAVGVIELATGDLTPSATEALHLWENSLGLPQNSLNLNQISIEIADLPGTLLGQADGNTIILDKNAAGFGWFIDPNPAEDQEFAGADATGGKFALASGQAAGAMDLLTVISHELGHVLGFEHQDEGVMEPVLQPGERSAPVSGSAPAAKEKIVWLYDDRKGELVSPAVSHHRLDLKKVKFDSSMWVHQENTGDENQEDWIIDFKPRKLSKL